MLVCGSAAWFRSAPSGLLVFVVCVGWLILLESMVDINLTIRTLKGTAKHDTLVGRAERLQVPRLKIVCR